MTQARSTVKVLVADDHPLIFEGLRRVLEEEPGLKVVGLALTGYEAVRMTMEMRPTVVLMDVTMPGLTGIDATTQICSQLPETRVIALSMHIDGGVVRSMISAGARAYVAKDGISSEIINAIRAVLSGEMYFSKSVVQHVYSEYRADRSATASAVAGLSAIDRQVVRFTAEGLTAKEIARRLRMTTRAVESRRARIKKILKVKTLAELARFAIDENLTAPPEFPGPRGASPVA